MADLNDLTAAQTIKIVGSDLTGIEGVPVGSTSDGRLKVDNSGTAMPHINRIDIASAARTTSSDTGGLDSNGMGMISFSVLITATSGTNQTMQISLDVSEDNSNWSEIYKTVRFTATGVNRFQRVSLSAKYYRIRWTLTGTSPSFTFSVTSTLKAYSTKRNVVVSNYSDLDLTNLNNVSSTFQAADASNISIMTIRGADGGNNGQFQVQASNDSINWVSISGNITQAVSVTILTAFSNQAFRYYRLFVTAKTSAGTRVVDIHWGTN